MYILATPNPRRTVLPALTLILVLRPAVSRRTLAMIARCRSKFKKSRGRAKCPPSSIYDERKSKLCQTVLSAKNLLLRALCCAATAPKGLAPYTLPADLAWFIDQLSEEIVLDNDVYACAMCAMPTCNSQVSGMTCRNGVKAWLLTKAKQFFPAKAA